MNGSAISSRVALLVCAAFLSSSTLLMAQAGSLDNTFGTGGIATTPGVSVGCNPCGLAIQSDGKILVSGGGTTSKGFPEVAVARFNTNGTLDGTFGTGGIVTTAEEDLSGGAFAMALQPDGRIVVATTNDLALQVIRYNPNGSLDTTFGSGGFASTRPFSRIFLSQGITGGIAVEPNGDILLAAQGVATRLLPNGTVDSSFGTDGAVELVSGALNLVLLPGGQFLVGNTFGAAASRYTSDGALDTGFGLGGQIANLGGSAFVPLSNGKLIAAGTIVSAPATSADEYNTQGFVVLRYNANGSLDGSFGTIGGVITNFPGEAYSAAAAVAVQSNDDIVAVGLTEAINSGGGQEASDFALARYAPTGQLDTTFGTNGLVTTPIGLAGSGAQASAVAIQSDGKIVVAGDDTPPAVGDPSLGFVLARYLSQ
jgi:uncharacterized delta-60 repeat protein